MIIGVTEHEVVSFRIVHADTRTDLYPVPPQNYAILNPQSIVISAIIKVINYLFMISNYSSVKIKNIFWKVTTNHSDPIVLFTFIQPFKLHSNLMYVIDYNPIAEK